MGRGALARINSMARTLTATVDCMECGTPYTGSWPGPDEDQELDEAPVAVQECPVCLYQQEETWPGWAYSTEAG